MEFIFNTSDIKRTITKSALENIAEYYKDGFESGNIGIISITFLNGVNFIYKYNHYDENNRNKDYDNLKNTLNSL